MDPIEEKEDVIEEYLQTTKRIRSKALSVSKNAAKKMVKSMVSKHPAAKYSVGCDVLIRRLSSKSKKKCGKGLARKQSRVVQGTIIKAKTASGRYKVRYQFNGRSEIGWYHVSDITSLTTEDEKRRRCKGN